MAKPVFEIQGYDCACSRTHECSQQRHLHVALSRLTVCSGRCKNSSPRLFTSTGIQFAHVRSPFGCLLQRFPVCGNANLSEGKEGLEVDHLPDA